MWGLEEGRENGNTSKPSKNLHLLMLYSHYRDPPAPLNPLLFILLNSYKAHFRCCVCISHVGVSASSGIILDGMVSACPLGQVDTRASTGGRLLCGVVYSELGTG